MENYNQENRTYTINERTGTGTVGIAKKFMSSVFGWMFAALATSALFAFLFSNNIEWLRFMFDGTTGKMSILGYIVMFAPLGFVLLMSLGFNKLSAPAITGLFLLYAAINGISFTFILMAYTPGSVLGCFISAAAMFGIMAVMGYTTDKDLTGFGKILQMAVIGIVVAMLVNFFMKSSSLDYIISIIGVLVFTGLTAYDVQKLKRIGEGVEFEGVPANQTRKLAVMGALSLYLDFINIFLFLLRLFGGRRD